MSRVRVKPFFRTDFAESFRSQWSRIAPPALAVVALVMVWALAVRFSGVAPYLLPSPARVWHAYGEMRGGVADDLAVTMMEAALGLVVGGIAGAVVAGVLWAVPVLWRSMMPLLVISQTVPMVVLAPLLTLWFGLGVLPKVVVVALTTFFPVVIATVQGLRDTNPDHLDLLRTMRATRRQQVRYVIAPTALPAFFAGLRIGASYAVAAAVIGEWVGASAGLGLVLTRAQRSFRIDRVFVAVSIIAAASVALYLVVESMARRLMPWQRQPKVVHLDSGVRPTPPPKRTVTSLPNSHLTSLAKNKEHV